MFWRTRETYSGRGGSGVRNFCFCRFFTRRFVAGAQFLARNLAGATAAAAAAAAAVDNGHEAFRRGSAVSRPDSRRGRFCSCYY